MDIQQNPSHLSSHSPRHQERAVQVAWPAINTVRMSSLLEGWSYQQNRVAFWVEILSKLADSWVTRLGMTWIDFLRANYICFWNSFTLSVPLLYSAKWKAPWATLACNCARLAWFPRKSTMNCSSVPPERLRKSSQISPGTWQTASSTRCQNGDLGRFRDALEECLVICFLFFLFVKKPVIVIVKTTIGSQTHVR